MIHGVILHPPNMVVLGFWWDLDFFIKNKGSLFVGLSDRLRFSAHLTSQKLKVKQAVGSKQAVILVSMVCQGDDRFKNCNIIFGILATYFR